MSEHPAENDVPDGEPFAWTPDDVMKRGVEEFKRHWPERWEAYTKQESCRACREGVPAELSPCLCPIPPEGTAR